jgi:uncharacterized membrane protein YgcG
MAFQKKQIRISPSVQRLKPLLNIGSTAGLKSAPPQKRKSILRLVRLSLLLPFLMALAMPASARQLKIQKFSAEIIVEPDSSLDVTETIEANFIGVWHGLYRTIPVEYVTPQGFNYTLFVSLDSAKDDRGQKLKVETSRQGHYLKWKIYVDDATDAVRTITLTYRVKNGLKFFEDHDELYWNVTGDEWDVPVGNASAQILLPQGVTGVRATEYTGARGSRAQNADVTTSDSSVEVSMLRPLGFHEGLTVVVGWDKGFVKEPGTADLINQFLASNWPLFFPVLVFAFMFWLWYTRGRDPRAGPIAVQYAPPDGLTPAEAGTMLDETAAIHDITATIVDLAVRGYIVIEEQDKSQMLGLLHNKDYIFHLKKGPKEWADLKSHELVLLAALFFNGLVADVPLSSLENQFYKNLPNIKNSIFDELMERGYFQHRPDYVRSAFVGGGIAMGVVFFFMGNAMAQKTGMAPTPFFIAAILSGGIIAGFGWFMSARTLSGVKALSGVLGFEDFLTHVEAGRMDRINQTPETFEKFLPFAMALGVEKKWVGAFQNIYSQPPSWYQGGYYNGGFQPLMFVNSLDMMTARANSVLASAPRSSGGSGFGGGGGSGGGFGGGGGGGF